MGKINVSKHERNLRTKLTREWPSMHWMWFTHDWGGWPTQFNFLQLKLVRPSLEKSHSFVKGWITWDVKHCCCLRSWFSTHFSERRNEMESCREVHYRTEGMGETENMKIEQDGKVRGGDKRGRTGTCRQFRVSEPTPSLECKQIHFLFILLN